MIVCLLIASISEAQRRGGYYSRGELPTHEISVYGLGGLSSLNYKLSDGGTKSGGIGGGGGIGYTFNINDNWGITTGAEVGIFGGKAAYDGLSGEYEYGSAGTRDHFLFRYSLDGYEERQNVMLFFVPITAQFKMPLDESVHFYLAGGFKLGLPVNAKATVAPGRITTSGDFGYEQIEYTDLEEYGFVTDMPLSETKTDINLGFSAALSLETGVRFSLGGNAALYTGAFFDYGLNNIRSTDDKHVVNYQINMPAVFLRNSVLNGVRVDKVNIVVGGLKIRISFGK
jgi:hypothetical protein